MRILVQCYFLVLIILLNGCQKDTGGLKIIDIDTNIIGIHQLSEIADSVHPIILETKPECLIARINKVKFSREFIYVSDGHYVTQFDKEGNFIRHINKRGRGPGEIVQVLDFCIGETGNYIYILSYKKLGKYKINGQLINETTLPLFSTQVEYVNYSLWLISENVAIKKDDGKSHNISYLAQFNTSMEQIDSTLLYDIGLKQGFVALNPMLINFSFVKSGVYFYKPVVLIEPVVRDTLMKLENNKLIPAMKFNFGENLNQLIINQKQIINVPPYKKFLIFGIYATMQNFFIHYSLKDIHYFICYDTNKNSILNTTEGFEDDFYGSGKVILKPVNYATNFMYFTKNGFEVFDKLGLVDENSNPVIFKVFLRR